VRRVCPNPIPWNQVFERLASYAENCPCVSTSPPAPLILAGWAYSNDHEKMGRWEETVAWANVNGCAEIVDGIPDSDFYFVDNPSTYTIGPLGGAMYRPWYFEAKFLPSSDDLNWLLEILISTWTEIVGEELARATRSLAFSGKKVRRLLVYADANVRPMWGDWSHRASQRIRMATGASNKAGGQEMRIGSGSSALRQKLVCTSSAAPPANGHSQANVIDGSNRPTPRSGRR